MKEIHLKEEELYNLKIISSTSHESIIFLKDNTIYKIFKRDIDHFEDGAKYSRDSLEIKRKKLLLLDSIPLDERFLKATGFIYINGEFRGYTMDFASYITLNDYFYKRKKEKINILKDFRNIILEAHKNGIILGDINFNNLIFKNRILSLCDLDNCTIGEYKTDSFNYSILNNYFNYNDLDENIDFYLFNILAISMITKIIPQFVLNYRNMENTIIFKDKKLYDFYMNLVHYKINDYTEDFISLYEKSKKKILFELNPKSWTK